MNTNCSTKKKKKHEYKLGVEGINRIENNRPVYKKIKIKIATNYIQDAQPAAGIYLQEIPLPVHFLNYASATPDG